MGSKSGHREWLRRPLPQLRWEKAVAWTGAGAVGVGRCGGAKEEKIQGRQGTYRPAVQTRGPLGRRNLGVMSQPVIEAPAP